jgi:hypothetical protein
LASRLVYHPLFPLPPNLLYRQLQQALAHFINTGWPLAYSIPQFLWPTGLFILLLFSLSPFYHPGSCSRPFALYKHRLALSIRFFTFFGQPVGLSIIIFTACCQPGKIIARQ